MDNTRTCSNLFPEFHARNRDLAAALGEGWAYEVNDAFQYARGEIVKGSTRIHVQEEGGGKRLELSWSKPHAYRNLSTGGENAEVMTIGATEKSTPQKIASRVLESMVPRIAEVEAVYQVALEKHTQRVRDTTALVDKFRVVTSDSKIVRIGSSYRSATDGTEEYISLSGNNTNNMVEARLTLGTFHIDKGWLSPEVGLLLAKLIAAEANGTLDQVVIPQAD